MTGTDAIEGVPIRNSFLLPAYARKRVVIESVDEQSISQSVTLQEVLADPKTLIVGGGSNLVFVEPWVDTIVQVTAHECQAERVEEHEIELLVDAGYGLDDLVRWTAKHGWYGLERLAEIPGTVGAAPIQNVGAYGIELDQLLTKVIVWDRQARERQTLTNEDCRFSYRHSIFKEQPERWLVLQVGLRLSRHCPADWPPLDYPGLRDAARKRLQPEGRDESTLTPLELAEMVSEVRLAKLPDWRSETPPGSAGSFFKNPMVSREHAETLRASHPEMPVYPVDGQTAKLSAAWLIDQCHWRGKGLPDNPDAAVSERHALVLVNRGGATGQAIFELSRSIVQTVEARFGITLEPEPRFIARC